MALLYWSLLITLLLPPIADKVIRIHDGGIQKIETNDHPADISSIEW